MINLSKKIKLSLVIFLSLELISAVISLCFYFVKSNGTQKTFVFPSVEKGQFIIERRNIPKSYMENAEYYVNEILLGAQTERTERLFSKDTKLLSCFLRDKTLYVNLSKGILNSDSKNISIKESVELFKKNILDNFSSISDVEVFVEGNLAYAENL